MKKNNILDILLLVFSFVLIIMVRYLYDNGVINNWIALILTIGLLAIPNFSLIKKTVNKVIKKFK